MKEIFEFLLQNKKWWLIPSVSVFLIVGILIVVAQVSPIGAFVYMLF